MGRGEVINKSTHPGNVTDMGLFGRKSKAAKTKKSPRGESSLEAYWIRTEFGLVPKAALDKKQPKTSSSGEALSNTVMMGKNWSGTDETLKRTRQAKVFLKAECEMCNENYIVPDFLVPPFFNCPACAPDNEKEIIPLLLKLNPERKAFVRCPQCGKFKFLEFSETEISVSLTCPACGGSSDIEKKNGIEFRMFSKGTNLVSCGSCRHLFTVPDDSPPVVDCPQCTAHCLLYEEGMSSPDRETRYPMSFWSGDWDEK